MSFIIDKSLTPTNSWPAVGNCVPIAAIIVLFYVSGCKDTYFPQLFAQNLKKILSSLYKHQKEKTPLTLKNRISYTLKPTGDTFLVLVNLESFAGD
jgi:hypothetical protein